MGHLYGKPRVWQHIPPNQVLSIMHEDAEGLFLVAQHISKGQDQQPAALSGLESSLKSCLLVGMPSFRFVDCGSKLLWMEMCGTFGVADAQVQGGMVRDLSFMRPEFIQIGGLLKVLQCALTSGMRLMTKAAFEKYHNGLRKGAMMFLAISTLIEFLCILLYAIYFPRLPIVNYYRSKAASEGSKTVSVDLAAGIQTQADIEVSLDGLWIIGKSKFEGAEG
ncbi:unnamed protein product [Prunus armeniaca]|uniref:Uncharacterized protein n=1 Tax=Prunus armeniaca TaxID=36596 RepID=A0A6J5X5Y4_PRUAR|nr:unnamed protein product [Prunus armeniaca]